MCIQVIDRYFWYFYLRHIIISKKRLQLYIWMVPPLFPEASCSGLVFSRVLFFFEMSTYIQSSLFSKVLSLFAVPVAVIHSTNGSFSVIKEQLQPHILSYLGGVVVISREHLKRPIISRALFILQPLLQPSTIASGLCVCLRKIIVALVL